MMAWLQRAYCDQIFPLWSTLKNWIWEVTKIEVDFSLKSVFFIGLYKLYAL